MKLAIVGCGEITRREHLPAALHSSKVRLHALIDTNLDNARTLADLFSLKDCKLSRDLASVINEVEGVLIATPNDSHFPWHSSRYLAASPCWWKNL
jgi:predicted dehydrogenase